MPEGVKRCTKCGTEKTTTEFGKHSQKRDGLHPQCRDCKYAANNATKKQQTAMRFIERQQDVVERRIRQGLPAEPTNIASGVMLEKALAALKAEYEAKVQDLLGQEEVWQPIPEYPAYQVSDCGRVRRVVDGQNSRAGTVLRTSARNRAYPTVALCKQGTVANFLVHRLVALVFIGEPNGLHVNHIDGDRTNNRVSNLEYVTPKQNCQHAFRLGLSSYVGPRNGRSKLSERQVREIRAANPQRHKERIRVAEQYSVSLATITSIVLRKSWKHL